MFRDIFLRVCIIFQDYVTAEFSRTELIGNTEGFSCVGRLFISISVRGFVELQEAFIRQPFGDRALSRKNETDVMQEDRKCPYCGTINKALDLKETNGLYIF